MAQGKRGRPRKNPVENTDILQKNEKIIEIDPKNDDIFGTDDISVPAEPIVPEIWQGYDLKQAIIDNGELSTEIDDTELEFALALQSTSPTEIRKQQKRLLDERRQQVVAMLDGHKLQQAVELIQSTDNLSAVLADPTVIKRVADNVNEAKDYKFLSEALLLQAKMLSTLTRLDTIDTSGTAKRINVGVQFQQERDGSSTTSVVVQQK